jgi:hypothetical protein
MSEVDRLSNSGLYPALPIADKRSSRDGAGGASRDGTGGPGAGDKHPPDKTPPQPGKDGPRPPKSLIDEYA